MLYHLSLYLKQYWSFFNVFHYVSVRTMCALLTSLGLSLALGERFIIMAQRLFASKPREYTPQNHHDTKQNMPTMGGIFILGNVFGSMLLWGNLLSIRLWICILSMVLFGLIGLVDDWKKLKKGAGISSGHKFFWQMSAALIVVAAWLFWLQPSTELVFPFFKNLHPNLGYFFVAWAVFVIVSCSNAVNLTDGLDGLAIGSLITNFGVFSLIAYIAGHIKLSAYLNIPFAGTAELTILGGALLGASLGFLWYNSYPAQIFMGDVGSVALGAVLGLIALMTKQEFLFVIAGGLFVLETVSVIVQVLSYKFLGRRVFRMAPIHHHFELLGWQESKITNRFAIISIVLGMLALMTLKMR
jgi:phospho-N-acetylmuramoyl-pentapeptide-transferase